MIRHFVLLACLLFSRLALGAGTDAGPLGTARFYQPPKDAWALQVIEYDKLQIPESLILNLVAEGRGQPAKLYPVLEYTIRNHDLSLPARQVRFPLWRGRLPRRVLLHLSHAHGGPLVWSSEQTPGADQPLTLPVLPRGSYEIRIKGFAADGALLDHHRFFLNVWESSQSPENRPAPAPSGRTDLWIKPDPAAKKISLEGLPRLHAGGHVEIRVTTFGGQRTGDLIREATLPIPGTAPGEDSPTPPALDIPELEPGRVLRVQAVLRASDSRMLDRDEILLSSPGDYPAAADIPIGPERPRLDGIAHHETILNSLLDFDLMREGLDKMVGALPANGTRAIELGLVWNNIEPVDGSYNWTNIDAYVRYFTERKIPFAFTHIGGAWYGRKPPSVWSDWMLNDRGDPAIYRRDPMVSPLSPAYREAVARLIGRIHARYGENPWFIGYGFLCHTTDSLVWGDHWKSGTDYSPPARSSFREYLKEKYKCLDALRAAWSPDTDGRFDPETWEDVQPPVPDWNREIDVSRPWTDWTAWKLRAYKESLVDVFNRPVRKADPYREIRHYAAYTGPIEYLTHGAAPGSPADWIMVDGGCEDRRMGRLIAGIKETGMSWEAESTLVPPENRLNLLDLYSQSLRRGGARMGYHLIWNSDLRWRLDRYPDNPKLQEAMAAWSALAPVRAELGGTLPVDNRFGIFMPWGDLLHRIRIWRWFALPGDRADAFARASNLSSARWLSEWTPDHAWRDVKVLLMPEDARVWTPEARSRLESFVRAGGHLILWGRSGQYEPGSSETFSWFTAWNGPAKSVRVQGGEVAFENLTSAAARQTSPDGRPRVIRWTLDRGTISWCLSDRRGDSERILAGLAAEAGIVPSAVSSHPKTSAWLLHDAGQPDRRYLIVSRFEGLHSRRDTPPVETSVHISNLNQSGQLSHFSLTPLYKDGVVSEEILPHLPITENDSPVLRLTMEPSGLVIYRIAP